MLEVCKNTSERQKRELLKAVCCAQTEFVITSLSIVIDVNLGRSRQRE